MLFPSHPAWSLRRAASKLPEVKGPPAFVTDVVPVTLLLLLPSRFPGSRKLVSVSVVCGGAGGGHKCSKCKEEKLCPLKVSH